MATTTASAFASCLLARTRRAMDNSTPAAKPIPPSTSAAVIRQAP